MNLLVKDDNATSFFEAGDCQVWIVYYQPSRVFHKILQVRFFQEVINKYVTYHSFLISNQYP